MYFSPLELTVLCTRGAADKEADDDGVEEEEREWKEGIFRGFITT